MKIRARNRYEHSGETWVDFERGEGAMGNAVFANQIASRMIDEWAVSAGVEKTEYTIRWNAVSFYDEGDAMLCYLRFK